MPGFQEHPVSRRRILQLTALGLLGSCTLPQVSAQDAFGQALLKGAGSTFVLPLIEQWLRLYRAAPTGAERSAPSGGLEGDLLGRAALDYEAIGSQAGLLRLQAGAVDFALTELPLSAQELARHGLIQIPVVAGGVAIVANLPRLASPLRLDALVLAGIFRGRITRWNDGAIAALNPGIALPTSGIVPLHRSEGSGTTYTLTRYLADQDPEWRDRVGVDAVVRWPVGTAVRGSAGMAQTLASTPGSIGYLDAVQARATGLNIAELRNRAGKFVGPAPGAIEAATLAVPWRAGEQTQPQFIDAPGAASYPIVATVLAVLNKDPDTRENRRARAFLAWALSNGQSTAQSLGYAAMPAALAQEMRDLLMTSQSGQGR